MIIDPKWLSCERNGLNDNRNDPDYPGDERFIKT